MYRPGHEGVVLDHVGEDDQLGAADGVPVGRRLSGVEHRLRHGEHRVHVDACPGGGDVHRGTHPLGGRERPRDRGDESRVGVADALLDQGGEAPDEVDPDGGRGPVEGQRQRREVRGPRGGRELRDRCDRDALVDDGDAVLAFQLFG